jgi:hypothetical protein
MQQMKVAGRGRDVRQTTKIAKVLVHCRQARYNPR